MLQASADRSRALPVAAVEATAPAWEVSPRGSARGPSGYVSDDSVPPFPLGAVEVAVGAAEQNGRRSIGTSRGARRADAHGDRQPRGEAGPVVRGHRLA